MYYVNSIPSKSGDYGNPMGQPFPDCVILPDELLSAYIEAKGFVIPTVKNGVMQSLEVNQEALDAYNKEYPEWEPEPTGNRETASRSCPSESTERVTGTAPDLFRGLPFRDGQHRLCVSFWRISP